MESGFGPDGLPGAVVLTFDNLGEASQLERGEWPAGAPLGGHESVTVALPWLLDELDEHRLTATFFVEAINCELYPDALGEIATRGHELGMHGWRHERWASLDAYRERELLQRGTRAFGSIGLEARGFRPPGGELADGSTHRLREEGFQWCSPAGTEFGQRAGLTCVPFRWEHVDAYHLMPRFGHVIDPAELEARLTIELERPRARTLILHPFLMLEQRWRACVGRLLELIGQHKAQGRTWAVPGGRYVDWLSR